MFCLATVLLQLQSDLAHAFGAFARFDFVLLLALGGGFGAHLLVEFLPATLPFPLNAFDDVNGAALGYLGGGTCVGAFFVTGDGGELAQRDWATTR